IPPVPPSPPPGATARRWKGLPWCGFRTASQSFRAEVIGYVRLLLVLRWWRHPLPRWRMEVLYGRALGCLSAPSASASRITLSVLESRTESGRGGARGRGLLHLASTSELNVRVGPLVETEDLHGS